MLDGYEVKVDINSKVLTYFPNAQGVVNHTLHLRIDHLKWHLCDCTTPGQYKKVEIVDHY